MKKIGLILLTFVPCVVGYIINISLTVPVIGMMMFYVLPLLTTVFWFYLGGQYGRSTWKTIPALLIGNAVGVISLLIYLWQSLSKTDETMNLAFATASQMFSDAAPVYLLSRIALLFETQSNYMGRNSMIALQVISTVYMMVVFLLGYIWGKKTKRGHN